MRVSKSFKAVAAPLLYEDLTWKHMQRDPLKLVTEGNVIKRFSGIDSKGNELQHIKSIRFRKHLADDCPVTDARTRRPPLTVPVVHVDMENVEVDDDEDTNNYICLENRRCPLARGLKVKRLVVSVDSQRGDGCLDQLNAKSVEEHVVKLDLQERHWAEPDLHSESKASRLVVILIPSQTAPMCTHQAHDRALNTCILYMACQLVHDSRLCPSPRNITMVNFDDLDNRFLDLAARVETFEAAYMRVVNPGSESFRGHPFKSARDAALISIKFITLKDYLLNHDWEGVYTKEEAAKLLQAEDLKRKK